MNYSEKSKIKTTTIAVAISNTDGCIVTYTRMQLAWWFDTKFGKGGELCIKIYTELLIRQVNQNSLICC